MDRQYCRADTSGGVYLAHQLSQAGCWQGETWGYDSRGIWVDRGCRAEFDVNRGQSSSSNKGAWVGALVAAGAIAGAAAIASSHDHEDQHWRDYDRGWNRSRIVSCNSDDMGYHFCSTGRISHAEVRRQLSGSPCDYGRGWGQNRDGIWVDRGCRAEFEVRD